MAALALGSLVAACGAPSPSSSSDAGALPDVGRVATADAAPADAAVAADDANVPIVSGPPGCGLDAAAFCDTFDAVSDHAGRAGELDAARWSGSRLSPLPVPGSGNVFPIGPATLRPCRAGLPASVLPDHDMLVCDPVASVQSRHLMMAVAAQNYGLSSIRPRQPFDFAGRTGTIVFDAEGYATLGWISVELTDEPMAVPSFAEYVNSEGGVLPRNGIELQFSSTCGEGGAPTHVGLEALHVFRDHVDTLHRVDGHCVPVARDHLNHFEIAISEHHVEVRVSPPSEDGVTFAPAEVVLSEDVELGFSRGWAHFTTHNHATLKYSTGTWAGNQGETDLDAWIARWDDIGFDGPVIDAWREVEVPDALVPSPIGDIQADPETAGMAIGYVVPGEPDAPLSLPLRGVDASGAAGASIVLTIYYPSTITATSALHYRIGSGPWHVRVLAPSELDVLLQGPQLVGPDGGYRGNGILGEISQVLELPLEEVPSGDTTIELWTSDISSGYPPAVANVDLVLR